MLHHKETSIRYPKMEGRFDMFQLQDQFVKPLEIMVVDDESDLGELVADEFRFERCNVSIAQNGYDALHTFVRQERFDVLVADLIMPNMNGFQLIEHLQSITQKLDQPMPLCIMMTGTLDIRENEARSRGVDALFRKPFSIEEMVQYTMRTVQSRLNAMQ